MMVDDTTDPSGAIFATERLVARPWTLADADAAHAIYRHAEVVRFLGGDGQPHRDVTTTRDWLARRVAQYDDASGLGSWAVTERASGTVVGNVLLAPLLDTGEIEVGYEFGPEHWGQGYATEIARGALAHAWSTVKLERVIGIVYRENVASQRVLEKIGMLRSGVFRHQGDELLRYVAVPAGPSS